MKSEHIFTFYYNNFHLLILIFFVFNFTFPSFAQTSNSSVAVSIVSDECEAVLEILSKKITDQTINENNWQKLFSSEGYVRLKKREASLDRDFTNDEFKVFVLSDSLSGKFQLLSATLNKWKRIDIKKVANRSLKYLPAGTQIKAKIYPVIKPKSNSFVFDTENDPAIFLYLNPKVSPAKFENTLAHELHHIGYSSACGKSISRISKDSTIPPNIREVLDWINAFGEGYAMLAAAGGPDIHPHADSPVLERERWDNDMKNFNVDLKKLEQFFFDILNNKLTKKEIQETAFSFFGIQGPWYTVGWKMAATIEKIYGREKLIGCMCNPRILLTIYNKAALEYNSRNKDSLAIWSPQLAERIAE